MKLKFFKNEETDIIVKLLLEEYEQDFDYIKMIEYLYNQNVLEEPVFDDQITEEERVKINQMISKITEVVTARSEAV